MAQRWCPWPLFVLALLGCGSDDTSSSATTTDVMGAVQIDGIDGSDSWTLASRPQDEGFCLSMAIDPPIRNPIVVGQVAGRSLHLPRLGGDSCLGQQLNADPGAVAFQPLFVPFIFQGPDYRRRVIAGVLSSDAKDLELELGSGDTAPVNVGEGGLFVEFPQGDVVALRMTLDGNSWRCEMGMAATFDSCEPT